MCCSRERRTSVRYSHPAFEVSPAIDSTIMARANGSGPTPQQPRFRKIHSNIRLQFSKGSLEPRPNYLHRVDGVPVGWLGTTPSTYAYEVAIRRLVLSHRGEGVSGWPGTL
ncbi:hypothetical protein ANO14919_134620 [Xylariales sp. No.14919]|nr:hypothetical protein ANO14919_134620 [Xylariales sp. No.14919]